MIEFLNKITKGTKIVINDSEYKVKTKTWYSIEEDNTAKYVKCELSDNNVLVIIPDDNLIYIGKVIENMEYKRLSENEIEYDNKHFNKTGEGHQYIIKIEFGDKSEVEGKCVFEDYESGNNIISLGVLLEKGNIRADVFANIINLTDIEIIN